MSNVTLVLLILLSSAAVWTVLAGSLIRSAIGLAVTSVVLSILMFRLDSPLAAMFELSVCAGLITAIFISAITMIKPLSAEETAVNSRKRKKRYALLLPLMLVAGAAAAYLAVPADFIGTFAETENNIRKVLWNVRQLDLIGQIAIILVGIFAVQVLYKEIRKSGPKE
ncbi:MAG: NADH-quinone oxidoreductase subunit J [Elusimicrobiota bacterium]